MVRENDLEGVIRGHAHELGFDLVGFTHAERFDSEAQALGRWLEEGLHGQMDYMERAPSRRSDPREVLPGAKGIVVLGLSYYDGHPSKPLKGPREGRVARYAHGRDYHKTMESKLKAVARTIREEGGPQTRTRHYVDTGPVLERAAAERAGLGFIGKNTHLINPRFGSWILLGEVITNLPFGQRASLPLPDCGSCRLCIDACPTGAIVEPFKLDARKCISYLTIEQRGDIPSALRPFMGDWVFGCDICQEVCPFNHKASPARSGLEDPIPDAGLVLDRLMELREADDFRQRFRGRPLLRAKRDGLLRNAAVAAGNSGEPDNIPFLAEALGDPSALVRRHAAWALGRFACTEARSSLKSRLADEDDLGVIEEIQQALVASIDTPQSLV